MSLFDLINITGNNIPVKGSHGTAVINNEARSRKPVIDLDANKDLDNFKDVFQRYQPHKHFYKQLPHKDMEKDYQKEKMYSPCAKESSV